MLTVNDSIQGHIGSRESTFEKRIADILGELGVWSYHTADKFLSGVPDRYCAGGNWIEFKVLPCSGRVAVNPLAKFENEQKLFLSKLHEQGDRAWAAVLFQPKSGSHYAVVMPWHFWLSHGKWTQYAWRELGVVNDKRDLRGYLSERFGPWFPRLSNDEIYNV